VKNIEKIFGYESLQVQASNDRQTFQVFVNGKSYKLPEMGFWVDSVFDRARKSRYEAIVLRPD